MELVLRALSWLLLATSVAAQSKCLSLTSQFPSCVAGCITTGAINIGCTNTLDLSCQCNPSSSAAIQEYAAGCAASACGANAKAILDGLNAGSSVCACVTSAAAEAREAPQPQEASPACARDVASVQEKAPTPENCTSLAKKVMPSCAQECYRSVASDARCGELDFRCQCAEKKKAELTTLMMPCIITKCSVTDLPSVIEAGDSVCSCAFATGGQDVWEQREVGVPAQTPAPEQATPGPEPEKMAGPSTTCEVVTGPAADCAAHRPTFAPCGRDCLSPVIAEAGCGMNDFSCQCASDKQAALSSLVVPCVQDSCGNPSAVPIQWDASPMCACASGGRTSTTCYGASVSTTTSSTRTSHDDEEETASPQGAADRYGVGIIVGVVTAVFVAAIAL